MMTILLLIPLMLTTQPALSFIINIHKSIDLLSKEDGTAQQIADLIAEPLNQINIGNRELLALYAICQSPAGLLPPAQAALQAQGRIILIQQEIASKRATLIALKYQNEGSFVWSKRTRLVGSCGLPGLLPLSGPGHHEVLTYQSRHSGFCISEKAPYGPISWRYAQSNALPLNEFKL